MAGPNILRSFCFVRCSDQHYTYTSSSAN